MEPRAPGAAMYEEILLQPEFVRRLGAAATWRTSSGTGTERRPVLTGCGTSFFAACLASALTAEAGSPVPAVQAFELLRAERLTAHGDLLVALSHSGGTAAVIDLLERARSEGVVTILVTAYPESPAAALAGTVVDTGYQQELSWCHTISFTLSSLAALGVAAQVGGAFAPPDLESVARGIEIAIRNEAAIARAAGAVADASSVWLLGAGPTLPLAHEFALKLAEAAYIPAVPLELEQFFHGYIPAVESSATVISALPISVRTRGEDLRRVQEIVGFRHIEINPFTQGADPRALPYAAAAALQLLTYHVAMVRGTDPDRLRREDPRYLMARQAYR